MMPVLGTLLSLLSLFCFGQDARLVDPPELTDGEPTTYVVLQPLEDSGIVKLSLTSAHPAPGRVVELELTPGSPSPDYLELRINDEEAVSHNAVAGPRISLPVESEAEVRRLELELHFPDHVDEVELAEVALFGDPGPYGVRVYGEPIPPYPRLGPAVYGPVPTWGAARRLAEEYGGEVVTDLSEYDLERGVVRARRLALFDYYYLWSAGTDVSGALYLLYRGTFEMEPFSGTLAWYWPNRDRGGAVDGVWGADVSPEGARALVGYEHTVLDWNTPTGDEPLDNTAALEERLGPEKSWRHYIFSDGFIGNSRINELQLVDPATGEVKPLGIVGATRIQWVGGDEVLIGRNTSGYCSLDAELEWWRLELSSGTAVRLEKAPPPDDGWVSSTVDEVSIPDGRRFYAVDGTTAYQVEGVEYRLGPGEPVLAAGDGSGVVCLVREEEDWLGALIYYELVR